MNGAVPTLKRRDSTGTSTNYPLSGSGGGGPAGTTSVSWIQSNSGTSSPYVINPGTVSASAVVPVSIQPSTNVATFNAGSGLIAGTRYIGTQQTIQPTYNSAVQFPTSLAAGGYFTDFRASVTTVVIRATMSNATVPDGAVVYFGFGKASAIAAIADPLNDANVLPWFDSVGNDPNPFQTVVKPAVTIAAVSGQANTYDFTISDGVWFGGGNAPAYTGSTTDWLPYITLTPTNSGTTIVLSSASSASTTGFNAVTTLGLQGASGGGGTVPTMQAANNAGNTISNANSGTSTTTWSNTVSNDSTVIQPGIVTTRSLQVGPTGSTNRITQQSPSSLPSSYTLVLPSGIPTANQYMGASNVSSNTVTMAWQTPGGSASSLCIFSVAETSPGTGATLFAVGTRGGTVTNTVTGCGVTGPATNGSNWSFPAGNYLIEVGADYSGIEANAITVITNFGTSLSVAGSGGATTLYITGSKTQTGGDDIAAYGKQYMTFSATTNLYLTRFAGIEGGATNAQISANGNFQIFVTKLP